MESKIIDIEEFERRKRNTPNPGIKVNDVLSEFGAKKRIARVVSVGDKFCTAVVEDEKYKGEILRIFYTNISTSKEQKASWVRQSN